MNGARPTSRVRCLLAIALLIAVIGCGDETSPTDSRREDAGPCCDAGTSVITRDGGATEDGPSEPARPDCAAIAAADPDWEVCASTETTCEVVFRDGAGCATVCAAAGLVCAEAYEDLDGSCAPDTDLPALTCGPTGHGSDYCVCAASDEPPVTAECGDGACDTGEDAAGCPADCGDPEPCSNPAEGYEGFGRATTGGAGQPIYRVTNLDDSGPGSLREALSEPRRCVVFDVAGTIELTRDLSVQGDPATGEAQVTIDGFTAPSPGITLTAATLVIQASRDASNVIVRGIRVRDLPLGEDGIRVYGTSRVVIDHVSVTGFGDGAVDITQGAEDVTLQWSILGDGAPDHNLVSLIKYGARRITVHHNLFIDGDGRLPHCALGDDAVALPDFLICDIRNNVMWAYRRATEIRMFGTANVVGNYYASTASSDDNSIYLRTGGSAFTSGNHSANGWDLNDNGTRSTPFDAVVPATTSAADARDDVAASAGARGPRFGLDAIDQAFVERVASGSP